MSYKLSRARVPFTFLQFHVEFFFSLQGTLLSDAPGPEELHKSRNMTLEAY